MILFKTLKAFVDATDNTKPRDAGASKTIALYHKPLPCLANFPEHVDIPDIKICRYFRYFG